MNHERYDNSYIDTILREVKTIAIVGASANEARPSFFVLRYLLQKGYQVFPINPGQAGKMIAGRPVFASLKDVPVPIDMVDIFRNTDAVPGILAQALSLDPRPKVIWMQLGVRHDEAARLAEDAGIKIVMNRCPKIEFGRLSGEIGWAGVNSRLISAKKPANHGAGFQQLGLARHRDKP